MKLENGVGPAVDDTQIDHPSGHRREASSAGAGALEYQETAVGRLPVGPAADAALAAAAAPSGPAPGPVGQRRSADVLDLGAASRGAVLKRLVPALAGVLGAAIAIVIWRRSTS